MLNEEKVLNVPTIEKKTFLEKTFEKFWRFKNKPYLCIRFPKESLEEKSSLKDLDINKQVVQVLSGI